MADFTPLNREMKERAKAQRKTMTGMESNSLVQVPQEASAPLQKEICDWKLYC